jgi:DNA-binding transcriptional regulator YiaG
MGAKGQGKSVAWLRAHVGHTDDECLIWPFARNRQKGYGMFGHLGDHFYAHRYMCELVKGPAPSSQHQAAHSCGNGHLGCVNPKHLSWKTNGENQLERRSNSRRNRESKVGNRTRLTEADVAEIRRQRGVKTQAALADEFNVSVGCIEYWQKHDRPPVPPGTSAPALARRARVGRF